MECVTCVCIWLGEGGRCWGEWIRFTNHGGTGESGICVCDLVAVVWVVLESVWVAWVREGGVKSVFVIIIMFLLSF